MPADKTSVAMNAKNTIIAAIKLLLNDRGVRCRNAFVAKTRDNTRFISVIVLLLVGRCQKRAAALSARERSEFIPTWKQALAEWLNFPEAQMRRRDNFVAPSPPAPRSFLAPQNRRPFLRRDKQDAGATSSQSHIASHNSQPVHSQLERACAFKLHHSREWRESSNRTQNKRR